ncbi:MAG: hypothetical protein ABIR96_04020 [Bdellovibrionota bacterium]
MMFKLLGFLVILFASRTVTAAASARSVRLWKGVGNFAVVYADRQQSQDCSLVLVELIVGPDQIHLSTSYNCDDQEEDQDFVPLSLERRGEDLFYAHRLVGHLRQETLALKLKTGTQVETYWLDFHNARLEFRHLSDLGNPGIGVLEAELSELR